MKHHLPIIALSTLISCFAYAQAPESGLLERSQIDEKYKWDTQDVYPDVEAWEVDYLVVEEMLPTYDTFRGSLGDAGRLLSCLRFDEELMKKRERLWLYAKLHRDVEMQNTLYSEMWAKQGVLTTSHQVARSFIESDIISLPAGRLERMMIEEPDLRSYAHYLEVLQSKRPHTLPSDKEDLLSSVAGILAYPYSVFGNLVYAELPFPVIRDEQGNDMMLNRTNSWRARSSNNRNVRRTGYQEYYKSLGKYQSTLVTNLNGYIVGKVFLANTRNYSNALAASLDRFSIPEEVYHILIASVEKNLQVMHRWMKMKKEMLGLDTLYIYDTRVTAFSASRQRITWEEAELMCMKSLEILGEEFLEPIREAYENKWIDAYPHVGKETGGYSSGTADPHPYVKMNWGGELFDFYTLVHELGHYVHAVKVMEQQPYIYWDSPSFINEVASTTAENIAQSFLITNAGSRDERLYHIEQYLDNVILLIYNSCMMAEFELIIYELVENGGSLTAESLNQHYGQLLAKYYGPEVTLTEIDNYAWMEYPHYYLDYYLFSYATSATAAIQIAAAIYNQVDSAKNRFMEFLCSGNSDYPLEILKKAGVDMDGEEPYEAVATRMNELMDEMEQILKSL